MTYPHHANSSVYTCGKYAGWGCFSESFFNVYEMVFIVVVTTIFSFHHVFAHSLSNLAKSYMIHKRVSPELLRLGNEITRLKAELAAISPTSEFSAYFKTERLLKKAGEEYDLAVAEEKREQPSEMKVEVAVKIILHAVGILLLHSVSGIYAFCIPNVAFWPLSILLRFPSVWTAHQCNGSEFILAPVSMFVLIYCVVFTATRFCS